MSKSSWKGTGDEGGRPGSWDSPTGRRFPGAEVGNRGRPAAMLPPDCRGCGRRVAEVVPQQMCGEGKGRKNVSNLLTSYHEHKEPDDLD